MTTRFRDWVNASLTALTGANVDVDLDKIHIVDASANASKYITPKELIANTLSFVQSGTGAVARTAQAKARDIVSVKDFGAVLDGSTDDTAEIQAAIVFCETFARGAILHIPAASGYGLLSSSLLISSAIHIRGSGRYTSGVVCTGGVNGFVINTGVDSVAIENLDIAQSVRFPTTPNGAAGITILGTSGSHSINHIFRDVLIDGFRDAIIGDYFYNCLFDNIRVVFGKNGIVAESSSTSNHVIANQYDISGNDGIGIQLGEGAATLPTESWFISDSIIFGGNTGIQATYCNNSQIRGCHIDTFTNTGILLQSTASGPSTNFSITDNYIGSASATHGIRLLNNVSTAQVNGNYIAGNQITHVGGTLSNGIYVDGTQENNNLIIGNRILATTRDIRIDSGTNNTVALNQMRGGGFICSVLVNYWMNNGTNSASNANVSDITSTYTPTLTNTTNLDGSTAYAAMYTRRGDQVTVWGKFDADPTAAASTVLDMSLPIASNLANQQDCAGTAFGGGSINEGARISADTTNDRATIQWTAATTTNAPWSFQFSYRII